MFMFMSLEMHIALNFFCFQILLFETSLHILPTTRPLPFVKEGTRSPAMGAAPGEVSFLPCHFQSVTAAFPLLLTEEFSNYMVSYSNKRSKNTML